MIASNRENLAVLIKPPGFEYSAILELLRRDANFQHDYFFDALWRFILQTEIAAQALSEIEDRPKTVPYSTDEQEFLQYVEQAPFQIRSDISVRLEQVLNHMVALIEATTSDSPIGRNLINEALHTKALAQLRSRLGRLLKGKRRVAIFVDNLDKGWERGADFKVLARLILGLLTAKGNITHDFNREDHWRQRIKLTVAIFLRSDIYNYLRLVAREPDKLSVSTIAWNDPETLLTVIESRYASTRRGNTSRKDLWSNVICPTVDDVPAKEYILSVVLPRPRDIVYFCNLAITRAIDRRHGKVDEDDIKTAEEEYSQYAYEALLVEDGVTVPEMEDALLTFLGAPQIQTRASVISKLEGQPLLAGRADALVNKLIDMSFLGVETKPEVFENPAVGSTMKRALEMATRLQPESGQQRLSVHRAFHSFLYIER